MAKPAKKSTKKATSKSNDIEIAVAEVVDFLKIKGDFAPNLATVIKRKLVAAEARKKGIRVTAKELQRAADGFRALKDLSKAADTKRWMRANGISVEALEDYLETNILMSKLKEKLAKNASAKVKNSKAVKDCIREVAYRTWLSSAMK